VGLKNWGWWWWWWWTFCTQEGDLMSCEISCYFLINWGEVGVGYLSE